MSEYVEFLKEVSKNSGRFSHAVCEFCDVYDAWAILFGIEYDHA
jgi:hypothetical protein